MLVYKNIFNNSTRFTNTTAINEVGEMYEIDCLQVRRLVSEYEHSGRRHFDRRPTGLRSAHDRFDNADDAREAFIEVNAFKVVDDNKLLELAWSKSKIDSFLFDHSKDLLNRVIAAAEKVSKDVDDEVEAFKLDLGAVCNKIMDNFTKYTFFVGHMNTDEQHIIMFSE